MILEESEVYDNDVVVAEIAPAPKEIVDRVLSADENSEHGRSNWMWLRLPNGDLVLGVYPQGDLYEECCRYAP